MGKQIHIFSGKRARKNRAIPLCLVSLFILVISAGPAFSSERDSLRSASSSSPLSVTGSCLSVLQSLRHQNPTPVPDRNQRTAGIKAAPLVAAGLVLGIRFALGPLEQAAATHPARANAFDVSPSPDMDSRGRYALAVAAYRQCEKQEALAALD